ncbi:MAG: porphobilinogen synthase [Desulfomicrobium sp.]|nr:porphobilinogen synthase [Pseudomonadota bacterium]MBV1712118.1 porphobilinogen synthase [Desulfomicrobium sp.]MBU4572756.1 porphobilinogen synthase [Pseudomonadota bacterium]MBU4594751.1 porphobilinogen synthase [Pseudomonadota bacterium]MBV1718610.1 porphobilinogen synthase [Desulfomicrobium sp.]
MNTFHRGRRLRSSRAMRDLVRESRLSRDDLIQPYFVVESDPDFRKPISSMPGQFQLGLNQLMDEVAGAVDAGLKSLILFGIPVDKDPAGSQAYAETGIVQQAIRRIKNRWPELIVVADTCLCEYTSHGHCGLVTPEGLVQNDPTLTLLARAAVAQAKAGADIVAPSDMMDGRVAAIRQALDKEGFLSTPIMSYAVKYSSAFYGPFRDAAESAPKFGDRKSYQMDPANWREALREAAADVEEGADILMVKPGLPYLDVIRLVRDNFDLPVAAYQVSGEYSQIKAAGQLGWIDETAVALESLVAFKRAGADLILSYFTQDLLKAGHV